MVGPGVLTAVTRSTPEPPWPVWRNWQTRPPGEGVPVRIAGSNPATGTSEFYDDFCFFARRGRFQYGDLHFGHTRGSSSPLDTRGTHS